MPPCATATIVDNCITEDTEGCTTCASGYGIYYKSSEATLKYQCMLKATATDNGPNCDTLETTRTAITTSVIVPVCKTCTSTHQFLASDT